MSGITNPAEPFFKDGGWGWDGTLWRKLPITWGYSGIIREVVVNTEAAVNTNHLLGAIVDTGEVWVINSICGVNQTTAPSRVIIRTFEAPDYFNIVSFETVALSEYVNWSGFLPLAAGDRVCVSFYTCVAGDDLYATIFGYKMKIAE